MENKKLTVSFQEIIISFILAGILPVLVNFGIKAFIANPSGTTLTATSFFCGAIALLVGLWSPIPLLGTSLLLGGSFLFTEGYYLSLDLLNKSALFISMVIIFGILLLALWHYATAKQKLKSIQDDWYAALAIREASISIIIPILVPFIIYFGLYTFGIFTDSQQLIVLFTYLIVGLTSLVAGFTVTIPSMGMSLALAAYATLSYASRYASWNYSFSRPLIPLLIDLVLFSAYLAGLAWIYHNRKTESKSRFIRIRNWATAIMFATIFPRVITKIFNLFLPSVAPTAAFMGYLCIAVASIATGIWFGTTYLGISFVLSGGFIVAEAMSKFATSLDKITIFFLLLAISAFLGFALWYFAQKKKSNSAKQK